MLCLFKSIGISTLWFTAAGLIVAGTTVRAEVSTTKPIASSVVIDAYWLRLTPAQLPVGQSPIAPSLLSDASVLYSRAHVVGFEGDEVVSDVTHTMNVVTGATPVVAPGVSTYELSTTPEKFGVTLIETPTRVTSDALQLSFDSTVTIQQQSSAEVSATHPTTEPFSQANPLTVDTAGVMGTSSVVLHTKSTVTLTIGIPTVVSAMSDHPGASDGRVLCLVLCATVSPGK